MSAHTILMVLALLPGASNLTAAAADAVTAAVTAAYPVNEVLAEADDACGHHALLRRGYYNSDQDRGFGFDKMYHKHNLKHTGVFTFVLGNPNCGEPAGGEARKYDAYAHHVECSIIDCEVIEIRRVFLLVDYRRDPGIPGQKGVVTAYCGNETRCADWVDESINTAALRKGDKQKRISWSYAPLKKGHKLKPGELKAPPAK